MRGLSETVTAYAQSVNATWLFFCMPYFASYAMHYMKLSGSEMVWFHNKVTHDQREEYMKWSSEHYYDRFAKTNMFVYGDLTRMPNRSTYIGDINWKNNDTHLFEPYAEQEFYYATVDVVPPPFSFV